MSAPELEMARMAVEACRSVLAREQRAPGESINLFYARKIQAVSQLIRWKAQMASLVWEDAQQLQHKMLELDQDCSRALEVEARKGK